MLKLKFMAHDDRSGHSHKIDRALKLMRQYIKQVVHNDFAEATKTISMKNLIKRANSI